MKHDVKMETGRPPAAPLWVKILALIALVGILLAAASLLLGVQHGPGLHGASADAVQQGLRQLLG